MNSNTQHSRPTVTITVPPRSSAIRNIPAATRTQDPPDDELRRLAMEVVNVDPVLAHLLVRAGERRRMS